METVYLDGKYSEQPCAVNTATGIATHLCTGACGNCKTYDQTYHADLSEVRECVTDPLNSRFTQERMDDAR